MAFICIYCKSSGLSEAERNGTTMKKEIKAKVILKFSPRRDEKIENLKRLLVEANLARVAKKNNEKSSEL